MKIFLFLICLGWAHISWAQKCDPGCLISGSGSIDVNGNLTGDGEAIKFTKDGNNKLDITYQRRANERACLWWGYPGGPIFERSSITTIERWRGNGGSCSNQTSFEYQFERDGGIGTGERVEFGCPGDIYCDNGACWVWAWNKKDRCKDTSRSWNERLDNFNPDIYQAVIGSPTAMRFSSQVYTVAFLENFNKFTVLRVKQTTNGSNAFEIKDISPPTFGFYKGYKYTDVTPSTRTTYILTMAANSCPVEATYTINTDPSGLPKSATLSFPQSPNCVFSKADKIPPRPSNFAIPNVP